MQIASAFVRVILLASLVIPIASCESEGDAYKRGYAEGHRRGVTDAQADTAAAREEGRLAGFKEGYEAVRPTAAPTAPTGARLALSIIVTILGMAKIVLSLLMFSLLLILDSSSSVERLAKMIATSLAMIVVFWLSNTFTVGFSQPLTDALLGPASNTPTGKLLTGLVAAVVTWAGLWTLEGVAKRSEDHAYVQTGLVFMASVIVSILVPLFVSMHSVPNINGYRFFDLILGVVMGGTLWLVHRLLVASKGAWEGPRGWQKIKDIAKD